MSKKAVFLQAESMSFSKAPAGMSDAELEFIVCGGHSQCESDDGKGTSSPKPPARLLLLVTDGTP